MSLALQKMWISFIAMFFMFVSIFFIYFSRYKFKKKIPKILTAIVAYVLMISAGLIILLVVLSGPTNQ